jgi:hypothetical protein
VEKVKARLRRATEALTKAGVPHAVAGDHAVAEWVGRVDEAAVRTTRDVDLLIRRGDFDAVRRALEAAGFVHAQVLSVDVFLDGPTGRPRDAVHILFAGEKVQADAAAAPDVTDSEPGAQFPVVSLAALVTMKLTSFRDKDRMHLRDLIEVGLVDAAWLPRLPADLAGRLRQLLETPGG